MAIQEFDAKIIAKRDLTKDVIELSFSIPESFTFQAGQFVMLKVFQGEASKFKSYSILSPPYQKGKLDLCIKIIEGGFASEAFKLIQIGDSILIRGTFGQFIFKKDSPSQEAWFIGTGTGIAPL